MMETDLGKYLNMIMKGRASFPIIQKKIGSIQLEKARELLGWSKDKLYKEIENRLLLIRGLAERGVYDYDALAKELVKYYINGDRGG